MAKTNIIIRAILIENSLFNIFYPLKTYLLTLSNYKTPLFEDRDGLEKTIKALL